MKYTVRQWSSW